jgi:PAS domain S-box-containing protein
VPGIPSDPARARRLSRRGLGRSTAVLRGPCRPKAEATLQAVLDAVKESVWLFDRDGVCLLGNETAQRRFGRPPDQIIGHRFTEVTEPDPGLQRMAALREVVATGHPLETFDERAGLSFHHYWYPVLDDQGRVAQVASFSYDITPRKRAEATLRESEARFRAVLDNSRDVLYRLDLRTGHYDYISPAVEALVGYTPEELMALGAQEGLGQVHPDDVQVLHGLPDRSDRDVHLDLEYRQRTRSGDYRWLSNHVTQVHGRDGQPLYRYGNLRDITERKRHEQMLEEARELLKEEARRKDAFLAVLGHELRNPLAPIRNAVHLISLQSPEGGPVAAACAIAQRQLAHLTRLVDDLLDVARIARGQVQLKRSDLDLGATLQSVLEDYRTVLAEKGLTLETNLPTARVPVQADATRIVQAVSNLLSNAVKFTPRGGRIRLDLGTRGPEARLRVQDDGAGIPADLLPCLFDPFRQDKASVGRSGSGLGLGLALAKGFVELHGGSIAARSDGPGRGAEFTITLPLAGPPGTPVPEDRQGARPDPGRPRRILVVEDLVDAAVTLKMVLELAGHTVAVAHDGTAALAGADSFGPDVVLCDIGLPGQLDGYQVARALRGTPRGKGLTLIAMTGFGTQEDRERALGAGFDAHLTKPVDPGILAPLIAGLDRRRPPVPLETR